MKKKVFGLTLIFAIISSWFAPLQGHAITLGEYEQKLAEYKKEAQENKDSLNLTQQQINSANNEIKQLETERSQLIEEVKKLNTEIEEYNNKIKDKLEESKQIIEYLQLSSGENVYLEYVFKAESTSDLIYRSAVVKELVDYNNRAIDEMKQIIEDNKDRQVEIEKRKVAISNNEKLLTEKLVSLGEEKNVLDLAGIKVEEQIKTYEDMVAQYKKLGCKSSDVIGVDCAVNGDAGIFRRPTKTGYITQEAYVSYDWKGNVSYIHRAVDIGSRNSSREKIYPVANGRIVFKGYDSNGALIVAIEHYVASQNTWYTSMYAHLSSFAPNISLGDYVTSDQYIGYMGDSGYSFGVHLHLEIFPCRMILGDPNCSSLGNFIEYGKKLMRNGYEGPRKLIYFPNGLYNSWNSR